MTVRLLREPIREVLDTWRDGSMKDTFWPAFNEGFLWLPERGYSPSKQDAEASGNLAGFLSGFNHFKNPSDAFRRSAFNRAIDQGWTRRD